MGDRGLRIIVGGLAAWFWLNWWWTGNLFQAVANMLPDGWLPEGFAASGGRQFGQSVTGTVLQLAIDLAGGLGTVIIFALSVGWSVAKDVIFGIGETVGRFRSKPKPLATAEAPVVAAAEPAASVPSPVRGRRVVDLNKVADALVSHDAGLQSLSTRIAVLESLTPAERGWYSDLISEQAELVHRVEAIESLTVGTSSGKAVTLASVAAKQAAKKPSTPKAKPKPKPSPEAK